VNWQLLVIAAAGVFAVAVIVLEIWRKSDAITDALFGRVPTSALPPLPADRWRRVHAEADRRVPFAANDRKAS
jgi:cell division protein FtsN